MRNHEDILSTDGIFSLKYFLQLYKCILHMVRPTKYVVEIAIKESPFKLFYFSNYPFN